MYKKLIKEIIKIYKVGFRDIFIWLYVISLSVSYVKKNIHNSFIDIIFSLDWSSNMAIIAKQCEIFLRLIVCDTNFIYPITKVILKKMCMRTKTEEYAKKKLKSEDYQTHCILVHQFLSHIKLFRPNSSIYICNMMLNNFPDIVDSPTVLKAYLTNLFLLLKEFPELKLRSFQVLLERILEQDCILFSYTRKKDVLKNTDIICTTILIELHHYLDAHEMEKQKMWTFILKIFEKTVLKNRQSLHLQFIVLYFCHFESQFTVKFLERLFRISTSPSTCMLIRKESMRSASSFIVSARFITETLVRWGIDVLLFWCYEYHKIFVSSNLSPWTLSIYNVNSHQSFHCASHCLLHVVRHYPILFIDGWNSDLEFERYWRIILTSPLSPLVFASPNLVKILLKILNENKLLELLTFRLTSKDSLKFPFDHFALSNSKYFFKTIVNL